MFFESSDLNIKILAVLYDERYPGGGNSGMRPFHALSFRIEGNALFTFEDKKLHIKNNELVFCPKNYGYNITAESEKLFVVHFDTDSTLPKTLKKLSPKNTEIFKSEFSRLYRSWTSKQIGYEHECKYIFYKILMLIEKEHSEKHTKSDRLSAATDYIHTHFYDNISISKLADLCFMSDTYFRKLFKQQFSVTPLKYINRLRTKHAVELLETGYYTVTEISEKCGFDNIYYFSLFIKKETGQTPSQIMKNNIKY